LARKGSEEESIERNIGELWRVTGSVSWLPKSTQEPALNWMCFIAFKLYFNKNWNETTTNQMRKAIY
jgi:hypothetical protein